MLRLALWAGIFCIILTGCSCETVTYTKKDIVKITDFELSSDESKIAFSAITPTGNLDIWVVDIDGKNLKKLTFQDRSPTNHIAKFFKKHHWANYFEIDMHHPKWTSGNRIVFCQELTKYEIWGANTISLRFWTINSDGADKKPKTDKDKTLQRKPFDPINRAEISDQSDRYRIKILLKNNDLLILKDGETVLRRLIQ